MWSDIKSILKDNKTKCVIIEDGKPRYVIIPFEEYQRLQGLQAEKNDSIVRENSWEEEKINEDIQDIKDIKELDTDFPQNEERATAIKIEDLPF